MKGISVVKVIDLFQTVARYELFATLFELYPDSWSCRHGYTAAYAEILEIKEFKQSVVQCVIRRVHFDDSEVGDPKSIIDVCGIRYQGGAENISAQTECLALEFVSWSEWLNMEILVDTADPECNTDAKNLAHIFSQMTAIGCSESQIQQETSLIEKLMNDDFSGISFDIHEITKIVME